MEKYYFDKINTSEFLISLREGIKLPSNGKIKNIQIILLTMMFLMMVNKKILSGTDDHTLMEMLNETLEI